MKFHPDVLAAHAEFGGDLEDMQRRYDAAPMTDALDQKELEAAEEQVRQLRGFGQAYAEDIFEPLTKAEKDEMGGFLLSRTSAEMGRHLSKFLVQAADTIERLTREKEVALENYTRAWNERDAQRRRAEAAEQRVQCLTEENEALRKGWEDDGRDVRYFSKAMAAQRRADAAESRIKALEGQIEQAFRDGIAYGSNVDKADPDLAWFQSRARALSSTESQSK